MRELMGQLDRIVEIFLCLLMVFLVLNVSWQVITRFILPEPSSYTEEVARFLLMWIGLLGAAYAYRKKMHLGIDIVSEKLQGRAKYVTTLFVYFLTLLVAIAVLIVGGMNLVLLTLELNQFSSSLGLPMGLIYLCLPLSGFLIVLYTVEMLLIDFVNDKSPEAA
jgi:TRAP-type C4-dicarboxylate transport system permease small subunit|uniref:TRAP transporter small permease n=1 Tax=Yoonia sp. TaxID=2212373 RepID=UPI004047C091